jgi:hypothetical protein
LYKKVPSNSEQESDVRKRDFPLSPRYEGICTIMYEINRDTVSKITLYDFIYLTKRSKKGD